MSERLIQVSTLTEIADAIRDKKGTVNPIPVSSYASEIATIETGGGQSDKPFNLVSYFRGTLTEVDDVNGVIQSVGAFWSSSANYMSSYSSNVGVFSLANQSMLSYANLPNCTGLHYSAFAECSALETVNAPQCSQVYYHAFYNCIALKEVNLTGCSSILSYAFSIPSSMAINRSELTVNIPDYCHIEQLDLCNRQYGGNYYASFNGVSYGVFVSITTNPTGTLPSTCFAIGRILTKYISRITSLSGDGVRWVCDYAFYISSARALSKITLPICERIGSWAFWQTNKLSSIYAPMCSSVGYGAFSAGANAPNTSLTDITGMPLTHIGSYAFYYCTSLSMVNWSIIESLGSHAFMGNTTITEMPSDLNSVIMDTGGFAGLPNLVSAHNSYAKIAYFSQCKALTDVYLPACEEISRYGFAYCSALSKLTDENLPNCKVINWNAFNSCSTFSYLSLTEVERIESSAFANLSFVFAEVNFPKCSYVGEYAFQRCYALNKVSLPMAKSIMGSAFGYCSSIEELDLPNCEYVGSYAFASCSLLSKVSLPALKSYDISPFYSCPLITELDLPSLEYAFVSLGGYAKTVKLTNIQEISSYAFAYMSRLESLYIYASSVPKLMDWYGPFANTPIVASSYLGYFGSIYVPASLYDEYRTATNWTQLKSRFVSM